MVNAQTKNYSKIRKLAECAILVALGALLSLIKIDMPQGGSFTPVSMLPVIFVGMRFGPLWSLGSGVVYSALQMLQGVYPPPVQTFWYFLLVILLDYVAAFTVLGVSGFFPKSPKGMLFAVPVCMALRFLCHFASGIAVWSSYAWEGWPVWLYSAAYNGSYMGVELALTMLVCVLLYKRGILKKLIEF